MIIKGEFGSYEVVWTFDVVEEAYVRIYRDSLTKKVWFGLREVKNDPDYTTYAVSSVLHRIDKYTAERMLPHQLETWFKRAVAEYETFHKAWNK